jgi:hypothetical protein
MAEQIAAQQFPAQRDGHTVVVPAGARFPATHPIVKAHPTMFEPAPTEKRGRRRKAKP